ncbi:nucleotide exchange factor GrpE [Sporichthya polymorpha]|uniref:nucleotide exchange factor GrpE n=1 Tax=Sporichthya polymorpha TaxID=35751 RepID=UPI0003807F77|nr:nucleotide exchange factor GrpE [Sporichthya polymorpha]
MTSENEQTPFEPVIRDKRRIDPTTGEVRPDATSVPGGVSDAAPGGAPNMTPPMAPPGSVGGPNDGAVEAELAERTADLQRVTAEYANYRKRVDRDREAVRELASIAVLSELVPVLDDIGRARDHGELVGGFKVVAEGLEATLNKLGLQAFGTEGDAFDPNVHEALMHEYSAEVSEPTCVQILQAGYRVGERILRPARVKVAEPDPSAEN